MRADGQMRSARWAISFADLALLLLGFFVLLQASGHSSTQVLNGVGAQFGAKPMAQGENWRADALFVPGEAMLTPAGIAKIEAVARHYVAQGASVELASAGQDSGTARFDSWDLAAARLGAVARSLKNAGLREDALVIRGLDQRAEGASGQVIRVIPGRRSPPH
ncbi:flagellar motor protein MotB [Sphingobium algorifonticola]|uniref:Flagellar motor protein n=1 Tax=Sphingobium algorifonticola TaxID=2008318 RepID=A0A437JBR3_9SPHN|nr:flagellar motor protein MotB [Sphingobium algorifonticola]RVT43348.1 flagellar motor protein [Sphingobium algorifonticola]